MNHSQRFIEQARSNYAGTPEAIAWAYDKYDEIHVVIRMSPGYYLDWIGGEYADEPDEFEEQPAGLNLNWRAI
jgi:hypothetical protein